MYTPREGESSVQLLDDLFRRRESSIQKAVFGGNRMRLYFWGKPVQLCVELQAPLFNQVCAIA